MKTNSHHDFIRACKALDKVYVSANSVSYPICMVSTIFGKIDIFLENEDRWTYDPDTDTITKA